MGRRAHIWFWKKRRVWCVDIDRRRIILGPDKREAERQFHALKAKPKKVIPKNGLCVLIDEFLVWVSLNRSTDTLEWYTRRLRAFDGMYPDLRVDELKSFHVRRWIDSYPKLSSGSKRNLCRAIQRCLRWCEEEGLIERSPLTHLKKPAGGVRDLVISEEEYHAILKTAKKHFKDLVSFAWETGARAAELFMMEIRHIELANHRVVFPVNESKMRKIPRVLYLNAVAEGILKRLIGRRKVGSVFRNSDGVAWTADSVNCAFQRVKAKVGKKYCLTSIRHSWCHRMLKSGVDALTVSVLMGHADTSMVARVYSHLTQAPDHLLRAVRGKHRSA